jgi:hypothetical protein
VVVIGRFGEVYEGCGVDKRCVVSLRAEEWSLGLGFGDWGASCGVAVRPALRTQWGGSSEVRHSWMVVQINVVFHTTGGY